ncbi:MAG TPA: chemotaxis protein CheD [Caulobacterales bacterium]|nr:chemotaxis protein CheD [Caulobacterales bacterium]
MIGAHAHGEEGLAGRVIHVVQGEHFVTDDANAVMTTVLGSCVSACMRDPVSGVGGMNHFLLPGALAGQAHDLERGVHAMELLINALLKAGARRDRLEAKLFGGARMMQNLSDIGAKNAAFAADFLRQERIACRSESLGGESARRIRYWPVSGRAKQMLLGQRESDVFAREIRHAAAPAPSSADVEFFD